MFLLAFLILPVLIIGNLFLAGINIAKKKMHPISVLLCLAVPVAVYFVQVTFFPEQQEQGFIVFVRYPETVLIQTTVNAVILMILRLSLSHEKNPRRNYYRDAEEESIKKDSISSTDLLDN